MTELNQFFFYYIYGYLFSDPKPIVVHLGSTDVMAGETVQVTCVVKNWDGYVSNMLSKPSLIILCSFYN